MKRKYSNSNNINGSKRRRSSLAYMRDIKIDTNVIMQHEPGILCTVGQGDIGQLGLGPDVLELKKPRIVDFGENVSQVVCGGMHTVVLTVTNKLYTFGCSDEGALGRNILAENETSTDADRTMECVPGIVKIPNSNKIIQISAGDSHTAVLDCDGNVFMWGCFRDSSGVIGLIKESEIETKPIIMKFKKTIKISSGSNHIALLTDNGEIYTAGAAEQGQLGRVAEYFVNRGGRKGIKNTLLNLQKIKVVGSKKIYFTDVWCGAFGTYAYSSNERLFAWGLNNFNQLGTDFNNNQFIPVEINLPFEGKPNNIAVGQHHTLISSQSGIVYSLGRYDYGRLGVGEKDMKREEFVHKPTKIDSSLLYTYIACGEIVSFAIDKSGKTYAWGMGTNGQLSQNDEEDIYSPTLMKGKNIVNRKCYAVSSGGQHTALIVSKDNI
ncbi:Regulator of chromosome condensation [Intoshia linei]|uniref:Regulator of chromosome condensation n=1 Tax=Intoshia linei TaxID=1819745 RepID=A0A177BCK7_9BILA|nr:Regulator of chromosome condensation [Intoshia linei]